MVLQTVFFVLLSLSNPGIPQRFVDNLSTADLERAMTSKLLYCSICKIIIRAGSDTEHCPDCDICIEGMDHHCPWSSKCIGRGNL